MTGSAPFLIEKTEHFQRSFKKLAKAFGKQSDFLEKIAELLENLIDDPYPVSSRQEPLPSKMQLPEHWNFTS